MKKVRLFGEYLQEFFSKLQPRIQNQKDIGLLDFVFNNWITLIQNYPKPLLRDILKSAQVESLESQTLTLKVQNSSEIFILKAEEMKILEYINMRLSLKFDDIDIINKLTIMK